MTIASDPASDFTATSTGKSPFALWRLILAEAMHGPRQLDTSARSNKNAEIQGVLWNCSMNRSSYERKRAKHAIWLPRCTPLDLRDWKRAIRRKRTIICDEHARWQNDTALASSLD